VIWVNDHLSIPEAELTFVASRSGGPGGQNVNKVSSRVTVMFDVRRSPVLSNEQRERLLKKLSTRINKEGVLRIVSQRTRSQELNREDAVRRFAELLRQALVVDRLRVETRTPRTAHAKRLEEKKRRTTVKQFRSKKDWDGS